MAVSGEFISQGEIVSTAGGKRTTPVRLDVNGERRPPWRSAGGAINAGSASSSEVVAGALQDRRRAVSAPPAQLRQRLGADRDPDVRQWRSAATTARYYTPSGRSIQGIGIVPDVPVAETREEDPISSR